MPTLRLLAALLILSGAAAAQTQQGQMTPPPPPPPPGLVVETGLSGYLDVKPNASRTLPVTLRNEGNETLDLSLTVREMSQQAILALQVDRSAVTLAPGESAVVELNVTATANATENATTWIGLVAARTSTRELLNEPIPVRIGDACPDCTPPARPSGPMRVERGPGGPQDGGAGEIVIGPTSRSNATREAPPDDDPYAEVPGAGALVALGAGALAALTRARRGTLTAGLVALALLAPTALAQEERTFALVSASRDGRDVEVTLRNSYGYVSNVVVSLYDASGRLLAPERQRDSWDEGRRVTFDFEDIDAEDVEVRISYIRDGGRELEDRIPLPLPPLPAARLDVIDVVRERDELTLTLENLGDAASENASARLEDAQGARVGSPYARALPALDPGERARLEFAIPTNLTRATLVVEEGNDTLRIALQLPEPEAGPRVELVDATLDANGTARFVLAHLAGPPLVDPVAHLETLEAVRVGTPTALRMDDLASGEVATLAFAVGDEEALRLVVEHADGSLRFDVALDESSGNGSSRLEVETDLPSREPQPGDAANFDLTIRNEGDEARLSLRAEGLPAGYDATFTVGGSAARTLVVPEGDTRSVVVSVNVPDSGARDAGRTFPFEVVVEQDGEEVARVDLSITVRGEPRLELQGQNWFATAAPGQPQTVSVLIRNTGSAAVSDVELDVSAPTGWTVTFDPDRIDRIDAGAAREVQVELTPPADAGAGRYVLDIAAASDDATARSRSLSVEIVDDPPSRIGWLLGAAIAGLAATALIVKLRRR